MTGARAAPKPLLFDCSQKGGRHKYGPCTAQPGPHPTYSQLPWPETLHKSESQQMCYFSLMLQSIGRKCQMQRSKNVAFTDVLDNQRLWGCGGKVDRR